MYANMYAHKKIALIIKAMLFKKRSGRDSNPRPRAWQARILTRLNYQTKYVRTFAGLNPRPSRLDSRDILTRLNYQTVIVHSAFFKRHKINAYFITSKLNIRNSFAENTEIYTSVCSLLLEIHLIGKIIFTGMFKYKPSLWF